jgi:hypothetical protein
VAHESNGVFYTLFYEDVQLPDGSFRASANCVQVLEVGETTLATVLRCPASRVSPLVDFAAIT